MLFGERVETDKQVYWHKTPMNYRTTRKFGNLNFFVGKGTWERGRCF